MSDGESAGAARRNGTWTALQQFITMGANAVIAILLVRSVSVAEYGYYSYALGLTSIGVAVMTAGLSGLAVRKLVDDPGRNALIVTTLLVTREAFALVAYALVALASLSSGDPLAVTATLIAGLALFGRAMDAPDMWFLSKLRSRETVVLRLSVTAALFGIRFALLWIAPSIWVFLAIYAAESAIVSILIIIRYVYARSSPGFARPSKNGVIELVRESRPLMLSGLANQINTKGDVILIQALMGSSAVGIYAAAARLSELAYFLPTAFMNATMPHMLRVRQKYGAQSEEYRVLLQRSYDQAFWSGLAVALAAGGVGAMFVQVVFGPRYAEAIPILLIHVAACPFVFMAAVYSKWIIAEGILWSSLVRHASGAVVNIVLNLILLPTVGLKGAAIASVSSYIVAAYVATFFGKRSRFAGVQMTRAFVAPIRIAIARFR